MKALTELDLRLALRNKNVESYEVPKGTIITPSAKEYLNSRKIHLIEVELEDKRGINMDSKKNIQKAPVWDFTDPRKKQEQNPDEPKKQLFYGPDGGEFDHKPEALTHLRGRQLVYKDNPVIIWRGRIDTLTAEIVAAQLVGVEQNNQMFIDDLEEILQFTRQLLADEVKGKQVGDFNLTGLTPADLRERSHDPVKFYGHRHMLMTYKMGPLCVALNKCRAMTREVELAAVQAFKVTDAVSSRDDIVMALNRLSSLFYILMFKYLPAGFEPESSGI